MAQVLLVGLSGPRAGEDWVGLSRDEGKGWGSWGCREGLEPLRVQVGAGSGAA